MYNNDAYLEGFIDCLEEFGILDEGKINKFKQRIKINNKLMKAKKEGNMNSVIPSGLFQHSIEKNRHKIMNLGDFDD